MKKEVKKEILHDLGQTIQILEQKDIQDPEELKKLSNHSISIVAAYKDLDVISITVLIYSIYKVVDRLEQNDYKLLQNHLKSALQSLKQGDLHKYNSAIKNAYRIVKRSTSKVKEHLQDVMDAARIKKGSILLQAGLSMGQAAGLMGLSNWDLQDYASKTVYMGGHHEAIKIVSRYNNALRLFQ
jgi:hypothetical protein